MRALRRTGTIDEHNNLQTIYKRTFLWPLVCRSRLPLKSTCF
jgi:hypothetical protein